jgi:HK97 gp10 family phage protein
MKVTGVSETVLSLRNIGERVAENARKTMHRAADKIVERARLMAPVDEGNLEEAIQKDIKYEGKRNRLAIDIVIMDTVNGVNVADYATYMHEGSYNLGPLSQAKQASTGVTVGPGFITRAGEEQKIKLEAAMIGAVNEGTKE